MVLDKGKQSREQHNLAWAEPRPGARDEPELGEHLDVAQEVRRGRAGDEGHRDADGLAAEAACAAVAIF